MIPIAAVLLLIVLVFSIAVVVSNPGVQALSIFGATIPANDAGIYFTGAGAMLVLILALGLLRTGLKRESIRRREMRALQAAAGTTPRSVPAKKAATTPAAAATPATGATTTAASAATAKPDTASAAPAGTTSPKDPEPKTTAAERQALLEEAEELSGDSRDR